MSENDELLDAVGETEKERKNRMAREKELEEVDFLLQKAGIEAIMRELTRRGIKWSMSF